MKKFLKFLMGAKVPDLRTNNPCELARKGQSCPFVNCYMKCTECPYFKGEENDKIRRT